MASTRRLSAATLLPHVVSQLSAPFRTHSRVCIGLSGGRDSVVLLHLIARARELIPLNVSAFHVNHQISPNADSWAEFCAQLCATLAIPLHVERVTVARDSGKGLEASARAARYAAFERCVADAILLAHHRDDQAETVLLQALRGAGLKGISAMPQSKSFGDGKQIIRPLLDVAPQILADYAQANNLTWIHDESNDDTHYSRNYIRHEILPRMVERMPQSVESLVRLGRHAAEAQALLDELAQIDRENVLVSDRLTISRLLSLSQSRAQNLLRYVFAKESIPVPNSIQLNEILYQLSARKPDDQTEIKWADWQLRCYRDGIYLARVTDEIKSGWSIPWRGETEIYLPNSSGILRMEKSLGDGIAERCIVGKTLTARARVGGEKMRLSANRPRRSLKNLLQEATVPPWRRAMMPLLFCDETLIWVPGIGVDFSYAADNDEPSLLFSWRANAE
jgi:tRNA(Ile)-lysidine synthase